MGDVGALADPPYALTDNAKSLMAVSDLVFVDPVSTGYSRVVAGSTPEPFHGYQGDVESVGQLIRIWTWRNKRWLTPKFVEGPGRLRHPLLPTRRVCTPGPRRVGASARPDPAESARLHACGWPDAPTARRRHHARMTVLTRLIDGPLLGPAFPLPLDRPFTGAAALEAGVSRGVLARLARDGYVRRVLKGVYVTVQSGDSLLLRAQALLLVVPAHAVVTDWTAVWLYTGLHPPNGHLQLPPICMFLPAGRGRLRNGLCDSGERTFAREDLMVVDELTVTTPLRTAWDMGRLAHRDRAIGAIDGLLRHGDFGQEALVGGVERFRKQRGVVQLRHLAPLADPSRQASRCCGCGGSTWLLCRSRNRRCRSSTTGAPRSTASTWASRSSASLQSTTERSSTHAPRTATTTRRGASGSAASEGG
jgi:hypothetical protein